MKNRTAVGDCPNKSIATRARREMEQLFDGSVFLEVWVKVRRGGTDSGAVLKRLGYDE